MKRNTLETIKSDYLENLSLTTSADSSMAEKYILRNYNNSRKNGYKLIDFSELPMGLENEIKEMVRILDESGIKEIGISESSTDLIKNLNIFDGHGWKVNGMFKEQKPSSFDPSKMEEVNGVKLERVA